MRRGLLSMTLALLATGCAEFAPPQSVLVPQAGARICHDHITLGGRFSISYRKNDRDESAHGSFVWAQDGDRTNLSLMSPLGQTLATIAVSPAFSSLTLPGQPPRFAADVDALAVTSLGWPLPVSGMRDWLLGCARDSRGRRIVLLPKADVDAPDGWHIAYPAWEGGGAPHPRRIDMQRQKGSEGAGISIRLVIDTWQPHR